MMEKARKTTKPRSADCADLRGRQGRPNGALADAIFRRPAEYLPHAMNRLRDNPTERDQPTADDPPGPGHARKRALVVARTVPAGEQLAYVHDPMLFGCVLDARSRGGGGRSTRMVR